jgi:hypothetical protein
MLLAGSLVAFGCQQSSQSTVQPAGSVVVTTGKSARIDQSVTVKVDSIQDSRCPVNVQCVWAGNAKVIFTLSDASVSKSGNLCLGACGKGFRTQDTTTVQLGQAPYQVILTGVTPAPNTDSSNVQKQAAIQVKKL